ncbi:MAG: histidine kinase, partial [Anaerolineales bacterium]
LYFILHLVFHSHTCERTSWLSHLLMGMQTIIIVLLLVIKPGYTFFIIWFYVLSIETQMRFSRRVGYGWMGVFVLITIVTNVALFDVTDALILLPIYLGGFFFFATFANTTRQAQTARQESLQLLEELQAAHSQLQEYAIQAEELVITEERNRLAREMHDTIGHRLTIAVVQLEGAQRLIPQDPEKAAKMVGTVREQVRGALNELRQAVATLREPLEADIPLQASLKRLVNSFEKATGIEVNLLLPDELPPMSNAHRLALYRTAQEALTNVQRHSQARQVWLQVARQENIITLRVSDNGKGLRGKINETNFGLRGIRERAVQLGGELRLESRLGGGAQVSLWLPLSLEHSNVVYTVAPTKV